MKITKLERQGVRLTICLARKKNKMTLSEVSKQEGLSQPLAAKVLGKLRSGGIVSSSFGRGGGYELSRPADEISMTSVLSAMGPPGTEGECAQRSILTQWDSDASKDNPLNHVWDSVRDRTIQLFDGITLADLAEGELRVRRKIAEL